MLSIVPTLVAKFRGWQERQRVLNELYALDDRALADIGLSRSDIAFVVKGTAPTSSRAARQTPRTPANGSLPKAA